MADVLSETLEIVDGDGAGDSTVSCTWEYAVDVIVMLVVGGGGVLGVGTQWHKEKQEESRWKNDERSVEKKTAEREGRRKEKWRI
jgi:hypothetical protein